jgi:polar amino acid transport system substrate-binding protein
MKTASLLALALALAWPGASTRAQTIRGVTEDSSYTYLRDGKVAGPASEIVETTLRHAGLTDYRLALYPWARAFDMALQEPNVLIYLIARTPARETQFKWAGEFMRIDYHLYKLRESTDIVVHSLQDAKRYSVGVMRDDVRQQYLQGEGFTKLVISARNSDNFKRLLNRQVQLVPMPERDAAQLCEEAHVDPAILQQVYTLDKLSTGIYMAYSKATPDETVARTRSAFDKIKADGTVGRLMNARP